MSGCRIFIGRLSPSAREKDVERFFKGYGRIRDIDLKRGFGFVVSRAHGNGQRTENVENLWKCIVYAYNVCLCKSASIHRVVNPQWI